MFDEELKEQLAILNKVLSEREATITPKKEIREKLSLIGRFIKVDKMSNEEIKVFSKNRGVVGVDGSYTVVGNTYPNMIFLAQALAKCTKTSSEDKGVRISRVFSDLALKQSYNSFGQDNNITAKYSREVTNMEVEVATNAVIKYNPFLVMFDGGFWRLQKDAELKWDNYKELAMKENILSVGVIEDIGSYEFWAFQHSEDNIDNVEISKIPILDSEVLFGVLEVGEIFLFNNRKFIGNQYLKAFARFSKDPMPIACDFLASQEESIIDMLRLVYSFTISDGRGIPFWIDVVDQEVKLTKEATQLLIEAYINPVLVQKLFLGKRNRR